MEIPGLADKAGCRHIGIENSVKSRIVRGAASTTASHAESHHFGVAGLRRRCEERVVCRVGTRPSAFDVIDTDIIERGGNRRLVCLREIDATGLSPVAERRVEKPDLVIRHDILSPAAGP